MPQPPDYYRVLGVAETASADEIKTAYRKLARQFHPDVTGGDKAKEARFKEITEAYETIGDEKKRAEYDALRKNPFAGGTPFGGATGGAGGFGGFGGAPRGGGGARGETIDLEDLFGQGTPKGGFYEMFSNMFRGGGGAAEARPRSQRGADVHSRIEIELPLAALGGDLPLTIDDKRLTVKVPPGIEDGQTIRLAGHGRPGAAGGPPGDILLDVHVRPHPRLRRDGDDLEVDVSVPVDEAILGGKVEVPTLEGPAMVTVPPATSSGLRLRLRGKGVRKRGTPDGRGDLYAVIQITIPRELPPRAKELLEEYARLVRKPS